MFTEIEDGDDAAVREFLLYKTPYYFRLSEKQNKDFFDSYWPGGFEDFITRRKKQVGAG